MTREELERAWHEPRNRVVSAVDFAVEQINKALDEAAEQILDPWCHQKIRALRIETKES